MCQVEQNGLGPVDGGPPNPDVYSTACSCSNLVQSFASGIPSPYRYLHTLTAFETFTTLKDPNYLPPEDCCIKCWITARDVQVFYWPVNTDSKSTMNASAPTSIPQSLISDGITFISPSVYVAYRNLRASDVCPSFGNGDFTRGRTYNTTVAYQPGFLSTSICTGEPEGFYQGFSAINLTALQYSTSYNGTCLGLDASMESTTNGPYLSLPQNLTLLDPAWSTCNAVLWGAFDPPIALHTATALVPDMPPTPAPGSPVAPPHAPATPMAPPIAPGNPATHATAPKADPQDPGQQKPHPLDPVKSSTDNPNLGSQDPNEQKPDPPNPIEPSGGNNGDPAASTAVPNRPSGGNLAQGGPEVLSASESNDPQSTGKISEGDPGADRGNGDNAVSALNPGENLNESPADHNQPLPSVGGHQIQAASGGGIIIAGTTIQQGVQTTIDSTPISVGADQIIVASSTIPLAPPSVNPIITLINGDIISAGGNAAMVSGTTVALAPNDHALVVNGKTSPLPAPATPILTVAGQTITAAPAGFAVGGQPVSPGGPAVTYAGSVFSLASDSNALIVNGITTPLPSPPASVFNIGSQTFTAALTGFAIGTQSVHPGGSAPWIDGTLVSLGSSELVIGASTMPLGSAAQARAGALGSLIVDGLAGGPDPTGGSSNASAVIRFTGESGKLRGGVGMVVLGLIVNVGAGIGGF